MDADRIADALTWLRLMVIQRDADLVDHQAQNIAYVDWLLDYPADLVVRVIKGWPRRSKFWPTWLELEEAIEQQREHSERPAASVSERPVRKTVRDGYTLEFAESATLAYLGKLGRNVTHQERQKVFGGALAMAMGRVETMGLPDGEQWTVADMPKILPKFEGFLMDRIR